MTKIPTSKLPHFCATFRIIFSTVLLTETSVLRATDFWPVCSISYWTSGNSEELAVVSLTATFNPSLARRKPIAWPILRAAPVTRAVRIIFDDNRPKAETAFFYKWHTDWCVRYYSDWMKRDYSCETSVGCASRKRRTNRRITHIIQKQCITMHSSIRRLHLTYSDIHKFYTLHKNEYRKALARMTGILLCERKYPLLCVDILVSNVD